MNSEWRVGLDLGSTAAKAALIDSSGSVRDLLLETTVDSPAALAAAMVERLCKKHGLERPRVAATGYGRSLAGMAGRTITEISCHARGVRHLHPDAMSILDIGGQDAKAIRLGPGGVVEDFAMNDRCAAGTGRFLEVAARRFSLGVDELSGFCGDDPTPGEEAGELEISSTCVVFAESELVGLTARGIPPRESLKAVHRAIARRVALLLKQVGAREPLYFTGGVSANKTLRKALERECGLSAAPAVYAQFAGALGAALFIV